jgi:hypothetical protein
VITARIRAHWGHSNFKRLCPADFLFFFLFLFLSLCIAPGNLVDSCRLGMNMTMGSTQGHIVYLLDDPHRPPLVGHDVAKSQLHQETRVSKRMCRVSLSYLQLQSFPLSSNQSQHISHTIRECCYLFFFLRCAGDSINSRSN